MLLTKSSKSPASIARSNKQLFGYEQVAERIANIRFDRDSTNAVKKQEENSFIALLHTPSVPTPKRPRCHPHLLAKISGKCRAITEAAG